MADCSILPSELLHLISQHLHTPIDLIRFRSVCAAWRAAAPPPPSAVACFPMLPNSGISEASWGFYLSKRTIYSVQSQLSNDSSWIIKLERGSTAGTRLLSPLSRSHVQALPDAFPKTFDFLNFRVFQLCEEYTVQYNLRPIGNLYMEKVVFMNNLDHRFTLLTVQSGRLAVFKSDDSKWMTNDCPPPYDDVILWEGRLYAVENSGQLILIDSANLGVSVVARSFFGGAKKYLVESDGELLLVDQYLSLGLVYELGFEVYEDLDCAMSERTVKFKVFRLDENAGIWREVSDLRGRMLFLGDNCTFSASSFEISGGDSFKGNCVFFMDQYYTGESDGTQKSRDVDVFDLESGCIGPISSHVDYSKMFWQPPDWVYSTLHTEG